MSWNLPGKAKISYFDYVFRANEAVSRREVPVDIIVPFQVSHSLANLKVRIHVGLCYNADDDFSQDKGISSAMNEKRRIDFRDEESNSLGSPIYKKWKINLSKLLLKYYLTITLYLRREIESLSNSATIAMHLMYSRDKFICDFWSIWNQKRESFRFLFFKTHLYTHIQ